MKNFYDIWLLSRQFNFEGSKLAEAIRLTFSQRKTKITEKIEAFSEQFINSKPLQWSAFRKKLALDHVPETFQEVVTAIKIFLEPIALAISSGVSPFEKWEAPGPWSKN